MSIPGARLRIGSHYIAGSEDRGELSPSLPTPAGLSAASISAHTGEAELGIEAAFGGLSLDGRTAVPNPAYLIEMAFAHRMAALSAATCGNHDLRVQEDLSAARIYAAAAAEFVRLNIHFDAALAYRNSACAYAAAGYLNESMGEHVHAAHEFSLSGLHCDSAEEFKAAGQFNEWAREMGADYNQHNAIQ